MKKIFTVFLSLIFLTISNAQNTADLSIENPTVNTLQTKFSFEVHITRTNSWGTLSGANALGNCNWYFHFNGLALNNPVLTYSGSVVLTTMGYSNNVQISGADIGITTNLDKNISDGIDLPLNVKTHVYTVELDILNSSLESDVTWDPTNTGIFNARSDASVDENYIGSGDVPLPVELSSFKANSVEGTKAQLEWETATEVNNYGFEIERSVVSDKVEGENASAPLSMTDNSKWEKIAFVEGHGNSNSPKMYSFLDKNLVGGSKFMYRLKQIDIDGTFEYSDAIEIEVLPTKYELFQNYPNPFNPNTNIKFSLPEDAKVAVNIYNILGEKVASILNEELKAGFHQVDFNTNSAGYQLSSGVYIYSIESKNFSQVKKMILMK